MNKYTVAFGVTDGFGNDKVFYLEVEADNPNDALESEIVEAEIYDLEHLHTVHEVFIVTHPVCVNTLKDKIHD